MTPVAAITTVPDFPLDGTVKTLGFGVIQWIETFLLQPDGDLAGEPFTLTREQLKFILWLYALDDLGRFRYRRAVLRRVKGWGKSPFLGAICLAELSGPVRFDGWGADGQPVGKPVALPWVVIAGVSETQTKNTLDAIRGMSTDGPMVDEYGLDVGKTQIFTPYGGKIVPVTASAATQEGARPTFAVMDEVHWWTATNGGRALARVIERNLGKIAGGQARAVMTTNAHEPGRDSVGETTYLAAEAQRGGRTRRQDILYDSREAPSTQTQLKDEDELRASLIAAYGDSTWVDLDRVIGEVHDPDTPAEESRRFYLNQIVAAADSWVTPAEWGSCKRDDLPPLEPGTEITLGFDGSLTDDSTALVGVRISDGAPFLLGLWEKPEGPSGKGWEIEKPVVRDKVDWVFSTYDVIAFFADVQYWQPDVDLWRETYGEKLLLKATTHHAVAYDMRGHQADIVRAVEGTQRAIVDGELPHNDDHDLTRHVLNARSRPNRWGVSFGKETRESPKKVDALAALVLARMARSRVLGDGVLDKRRKKPGRFYSF